MDIIRWIERLVAGPMKKLQQIDQERQRNDKKLLRRNDEEVRRRRRNDDAELQRRIKYQEIANLKLEADSEKKRRIKDEELRRRNEELERLVAGPMKNLQQLDREWQRNDKKVLERNDEEVRRRNDDAELQRRIKDEELRRRNEDEERRRRNDEEEHGRRRNKEELRMQEIANLKLEADSEKKRRINDDEELRRRNEELERKVAEKERKIEAMERKVAELEAENERISMRKMKDEFEGSYEESGPTPSILQKSADSVKHYIKTCANDIFHLIRSQHLPIHFLINATPTSPSTSPSPPPSPQPFTLHSSSFSYLPLQLPSDGRRNPYLYLRTETDRPMAKYVKYALQEMLCSVFFTELNWGIPMGANPDVYHSPQQVKRHLFDSYCHCTSHDASLESLLVAEVEKLLHNLGATNSDAAERSLANDSSISGSYLRSNYTADHLDNSRCSSSNREPTSRRDRLDTSFSSENTDTTEINTTDSHNEDFTKMGKQEMGRKTVDRNKKWKLMGILEILKTLWSWIAKVNRNDKGNNDSSSSVPAAAHNQSPPPAYSASSHNQSPPPAYSDSSHNQPLPPVYSAYSHNQPLPPAYSHNQSPPPAYSAYSHNQPPPALQHSLRRFFLSKLQSKQLLEFANESLWPYRLLSHPHFKSSFIRLSKSVWLLHRLAFSFDPTAEILRIPQGSPFNKDYMEGLDLEDGTSTKTMDMDSWVALMWMPGFVIRNNDIIKSQVICCRRRPYAAI